jgi:hypothetical protein
MKGCGLQKALRHPHLDARYAFKILHQNANRFQCHGCVSVSALTTCSSKESVSIQFHHDSNREQAFLLASVILLLVAHHRHQSPGDLHFFLVPLSELFRVNGFISFGPANQQFQTAILRNPKL